MGDDVDLFLAPFLRKFRGDMFNDLMLEEAREIVAGCNISFVRQCLDEIGAPKSWSGQKARTELLAWIELEDFVRPLAFKTKPELQSMAVKLKKIIFTR